MNLVIDFGYSLALAKSKIKLFIPVASVVVFIIVVVIAVVVVILLSSLLLLRFIFQLYIIQTLDNPSRYLAFSNSDSVSYFNRHILTLRLL